MCRSIIWETHEDELLVKSGVGSKVRSTLLVCAPAVFNKGSRAFQSPKAEADRNWGISVYFLQWGVPASQCALLTFVRAS